MLVRKGRSFRDAGFSLVEMLVVMSLIGILTVTFYTLFVTSFTGYLNLQKQSSSFTQATIHSSRVANVIRGLTDITIAKDSELEVFAYFYPSDAYVSKVRYYTTTVNGTQQLRADLTPMTADPPIGTPITAQMRTLTIIESFYNPVNTPLFTYINAANAVLTTPVTDFSAIKSVKIQMSTKVDTLEKQSISTQVMLRNRKTNL